LARLGEKRRRRGSRALLPVFNTGDAIVDSGGYGGSQTRDILRILYGGRVRDSVNTCEGHPLDLRTPGLQPP
jgi:hypothetical protein